MARLAKLHVVMRCVSFPVSAHSYVSPLYCWINLHSSIFYFHALVWPFSGKIFQVYLDITHTCCVYESINAATMKAALKLHPLFSIVWKPVLEARKICTVFVLYVLELYYMSSTRSLTAPYWTSSTVPVQTGDTSELQYITLLCTSILVK